MEQLKVIGTEDDTLVLATESGATYSLTIDEVLRAELRKARRERDADPRAVRPSPREIQAHIRAGLSAEEVAQLLGARVEDVARYERPVLAEREHIVGQALAVPVLLGGELEHDALPTFGSAIRAKLAEVGAQGERWTSWRESTGWIVKLAFTANDIERDARWSFEPRRSTLSPLNSEATQLSRQGSLPEGLIPRLRALDSHATVKDETRFDSGAFGPRRAAEPTADLDAPEFTAPVTAAVQDAAIKRAPDAEAPSGDTADLLEALRRRRGQREPLPGSDLEPERSHAPVALFDALEPGYADIAPADEPAYDERVTADSPRRKSGRSSLPSWDEIVFGARTDAD